jgi:subtilisin family serine protease
MRRDLSLLIALSITVLLGFTVPTGQALSEPQPGPDKAAFAPGRILVKVEDSAPTGALASVNRENDARVEDKMPRSGVSVIDLPADLSVNEGVEIYEASPQVEYAEPDYEVTLAQSALAPNDPGYPNMYGLDNTGQTGGISDADIDAPEAWSATTGKPDTAVAVIDTGVDINHPDLNANIWTNPDEIAGNGIDDDGNSYVDDVHGWDFANDDASVFDSAADDKHGTHVAGTIAAEGNNGVGVAGVTWQAKIMPLKFISPGKGYVSDAAEALRYAVDEGVKISNHSYGYYDYCGGCFSKTLRDAVDYAAGEGHLVVAAAMNGGSDWVGDDNDQTPVYPASHQGANVISVAASDQRDTLTSFSNYGATSVDLAAPGQSIYSTYPNNTYGNGTGTSMATPHVAGVAALVEAQNPDFDAAGIKDRILESVDKKASLEGRTVSGGRLNAARAFGVAPMITTWGPRPNARIRDRTPIIRVTVEDDETELTADRIELHIDGDQKWGFTYDQTNDTLAYRTGRLSFRRHVVHVVVRNAGGLEEETRTWGFRVVRRR